MPQDHDGDPACKCSTGTSQEMGLRSDHNGGRKSGKKAFCIPSCLFSCCRKAASNWKNRHVAPASCRLILYFFLAVGSYDLSMQGSSLTMFKPCFVLFLSLQVLVRTDSIWLNTFGQRFSTTCILPVGGKPASKPE